MYLLHHVDTPRFGCTTQRLHRAVAAPHCGCTMLWLRHGVAAQRCHCTTLWSHRAAGTSRSDYTKLWLHQAGTQRCGHTAPWIHNSVAPRSGYASQLHNAAAAPGRRYTTLRLHHGQMHSLPRISWRKTLCATYCPPAEDYRPVLRRQLPPSQTTRPFPQGPGCRGRADTAPVRRNLGCSMHKHTHVQTENQLGRFRLVALGRIPGARAIAALTNRTVRINFTA